MKRLLDILGFLDLKRKASHCHAFIETKNKLVMQMFMQGVVRIKFEDIVILKLN